MFPQSSILAGTNQIYRPTGVSIYPNTGSLDIPKNPTSFFPWPIDPTKAKTPSNDSDIHYVRNVPGQALESIRPSRLAVIGALYRLQDSRAVVEYLNKYFSLQPILIEAHRFLQDCFGPNLDVELRLRSDPEVEGSDVLFGYILTNLPVEEALERLERFDELWFLDALPDSPARLNFNLSFV